MTPLPAPPDRDRPTTEAMTLEFFCATDTGRARKLNLALEATATLTDRRTGRVLFEHRPLHADRQIFTDSGQLQAEYDAVPLLAEQLAQAASRATLDTW